MQTIQEAPSQRQGDSSRTRYHLLLATSLLAAPDEQDLMNDLEKALGNYVAERDRYHRLCRTVGQPGFGMIEGAKIGIADALLVLLGLPTRMLGCEELFREVELVETEARK